MIAKVSYVTKKASWLLPLSSLTVNNSGRTVLLPERKCSEASPMLKNHQFKLQDALGRSLLHRKRGERHLHTGVAL